MKFLAPLLFVALLPVVLTQGWVSPQEVRAIEQAFVDGEQTGAFTGGGARRYGGYGYNGFNNYGGYGNYGGYRPMYGGNFGGYNGYNPYGAMGGYGGYGGYGSMYGK